MRGNFAGPNRSISTTIEAKNAGKAGKEHKWLFYGGVVFLGYAVRPHRVRPLHRITGSFNICLTLWRCVVREKKPRITGIRSSEATYRAVVQAAKVRDCASQSALCVRLSKRSCAETNSPRNSRSQTHQNDGTRGEAGNGVAPALQSETKTD